MKVLVVAKAPEPGRVKTRLCPPLTPEQACEVALAALADTLDAVSACGADEGCSPSTATRGRGCPRGSESYASEASSSRIA